ncbi:MAG: SMI1/KNR4 family protein [Ruminococcus sp.]|uniref:SMI1/KNR4 family protein n=1 Tax=Ruminococcus sp. TaxID=41978 RepID=UPI0025FB957F|nr:SMI1/KNR4 family protein [Ruminococcus sp.]MBO4866212.1 SMI1/KNR4 family protein [Ruminococcus sp.]
MTLEELEKQQEVRFPQAFHRIYDSGAMSWLELSQGERKARIREYISDSKAFLMLDGACEMYLFEEVQSAAEELAKLASWMEEDKKLRIRSGVRIVPFGHEGGGDMYCLLYTDGNAEPAVVLYPHDSYEAPTVYGRDFDEFVYIQMLLAAENEEDVEGEHFTENIRYLSDRYRPLVEGKSADELTDALYAMNFQHADIWE